MKPLLIETPKKRENTFLVTNYERPYFHNPIHFHAALELTLILQGEGTRIAGDHIGRFQTGDLVLVGSNLPHQWKNDIQDPPIDPPPSSKAIVIHFNENFLGQDFFHLSETKNIQQLFQKAKRGLRIRGKTRKLISTQMHQIMLQNGFEKLLSLLTILNTLSKSSDLEPLANESYRIKNKTAEIEKLDLIYEYILKNLTRKISLSEMASVFNMSRSGFCRYFKTHSQKTFSRFVLEARISYACNLLQKNDLSVTQIAFESGFNQVSFFNREFRKIKNSTPLAYRNKILTSNQLENLNSVTPKY